MREYKIVVAGNGGVGKSALTVRFVQGQFVACYDATIEDSYRKHVNLEGEDARMEILDTAGTEQFSGMRDLYVRNGQGFILVYSVDDPSSLAQVESLADYIRRTKEGKVPIVVVANKMDIPPSSHLASIDNGRALAMRLGFTHHETSAKLNHGVNEIFLDCARQIRAQLSGQKKCSRGMQRSKTRPSDDTGKKDKSTDPTCCSMM